MSKMYDYFNGCEWVKVTEEWLGGVNLDSLMDVYMDVKDTIRCVYENGDEVFYHSVYGTWGSPTIVH